MRAFEASCERQIEVLEGVSRRANFREASEGLAGKQRLI